MQDGVRQPQTACTSEALHRGLVEFGGVLHGQQDPKRNCRAYASYSCFQEVYREVIV